MLTPDQINELHRLHLVEKWSLRKISRHLRIGRHTLAKYLRAPAAKPARPDRASKLDPFKTAIAELLQQDLETRVRALLGGIRIVGTMTAGAWPRVAADLQGLQQRCPDEAGCGRENQRGCSDRDGGERRAAASNPRDHRRQADQR